MRSVPLKGHTALCLLVDRAQESQSAHPARHLCTVTLGASGQKPTSYQVLVVCAWESFLSREECSVGNAL